MAREGQGLLPVRILNIYPYADAQQGGGSIQNFLVFLKGGGSRVVPITIGHFEGQALVMALRRIPLPRPLPHNLIQSLLERMQARVQRLVIHTLKDEVFHAHLVIQTPAETFLLDCRPSDGMILATLLATPVFVSAAVMEAAGKELEPEPATSDAEDVDEADEDDVAAALAVEAERVEVETGADARRGSCCAPAEPAPEQQLSELERLNQQLSRLIAEEAYEEAARVRDQIRNLASE